MIAALLRPLLPVLALAPSLALAQSPAPAALPEGWRVRQGEIPSRSFSLVCEKPACPAYRTIVYSENKNRPAAFREKAKPGALEAYMRTQYGSALNSGQVITVKTQQIGKRRIVAEFGGPLAADKPDSVIVQKFEWRANGLFTHTIAIAETVETARDQITLSTRFVR